MANWTTLKKIFSTLDRMEIPEEWKALFFETFKEDNLRHPSTYESHILDIVNGGTRAVRMLLQEKMVDIETLHEIATQMNEECQQEYYKAVKKSGVSHYSTREVWNKCIKGIDIPTLF